ncbi:hypothetical protein ACLMJK_005686 [Lecanora helva]
MEPASSEERTFRSYTPGQANTYAALRGSYHEKLYDVIIDHHRSTGGSFHTLLDVGCGPGNATRPSAKHFNTAYGLDSGTEMINTARQISADAEAPETAGGGQIEFVEGTAEEMAFLRDTGRKVDLITAATAVHWFDIPRFWATAAKVLNPGGTVALWTLASHYCHPSMPNAAKVQEIMFRLEREELGPYELPGNRLARDAYENLLLPWNVQPSVEGFSESGYTRKDWDRDGILSDGEHFFLGDHVATKTQAEKVLGTGSMATRWRKAHPELAGTEQDVVKRMIRDVWEVIGREEVVFGHSCHLLLFKRD